MFSSHSIVIVTSVPPPLVAPFACDVSGAASLLLPQPPSMSATMTMPMASSILHADKTVPDMLLTLPPSSESDICSLQ